MSEREPTARAGPGSPADAGRAESRGAEWGDAPPALRRLFLAGSLFFAGYQVWSVIDSGLPVHEMVLGLLALALFGALALPRFREQLTDRGRAGWMPIVVAAAITAIASLLMLVDPQGTALGLFYFAAIACAFVRPDRRAIWCIGAVGAIAGVVYFVRHPDPLVAIPIGAQVGFIALVVYGVGIVRRTNIQLLAARHDLARLAVAEERLRISRDLHDTVGHSLTLIALKTELIERLLPGDPARAQAEAVDAGRVAREALASVRETVSAYRQPTLDSELIGVRQALDAAGVETRVEVLTPPASPASATLLAWAIREGGTNVLRHSGARHATIRVGSDAGLAFAEIVDDGVGRPSGGAAATPGTVGGSGLAGLAERVASQGGRLEAGPRPEGGYRLRVTVPIEAGA